MWAAILEGVNKLLGIVDRLTGFFIGRADARKKKKDIAQANADKAVKDESSDDFLDSINDKRGA